MNGADAFVIKVKLYTSTTCAGTSFSATVGACVQAGSPFQSANVTCV